MTMKQMEVTIMGQSYVLGCPEGGESDLLEAVSQVDREMSAIRDAGKVKARERIAVLAALNLGYQLASRPAIKASPSATTVVVPTGVDLEGLVQRLDEALNEDGRLF
jgi:cell division protein ZapA